MTPDESLAYLYDLQRFGIKLGLQNIRALLERLGHPQVGLRCVHVAGTNGKGSVSMFLAEILRHAGYRVGLYTSPHLHGFTERIRIDGEVLALNRLPCLVQQVKDASVGIPATFFEATTALALLAFRAAAVEVAVLETGMGGRFDATNVVEPALCLITPVALDHQEYLGTTLTAIAAEKAGIIKPGVPVVSGAQEPEVQAVLAAMAASQGALLWQAGRDYRWRGEHAAMWFRAGALELTEMHCALAGAHQLANYAHALAGAALLRRGGLPISAEAMRQAGVTARWPGRLEWWGNPPVVLLDGAHNAAGAAALARYLADEVRRPVRLVAGLSGQRQPAEVLAPLVNARCLLQAVYAAPVPEGLSVWPEALVTWAQQSGLPARAFVTPDQAFGAAIAERNAEDVVVVAGSLYLVAAIRELLRADAAWSSSAGGEAGRMPAGEC